MGFGVAAILLAAACNGGDTRGTGGAGSGGTPGTGASADAGHGGAVDAGPDAAPPCLPIVVPSGPPFVDRAAELGIDFERHNTAGFCDNADILGGGACVFDYDGDGDLDIYFTDRAPYSNRLYRNDGGKFTDVTVETGTGAEDSDSMGCLAFDLDGDGDLDIYLANVGPDRILRNDGGKFTDVTAEVGLVEDGLTTSVAAGDLDGDGDLDLFVAHYVDQASCAPECGLQPETCTPERSLLFINEGGHLVEAGLARGIAYAEPVLASVVFDFDNDGDLDIFVGNDVGKHFQDRLYLNDGTGHFQDYAAELGVAWDAVGDGIDTMGVAVGDWDRDGTLDLAETNFSGQPTILFHCNAGHVCVDSHLEGKDLDSSIPYLKWGIGLVDFDNDGFLDVFTASGGIKAGSQQRNQLYFNHFANFAEHVPKAGDALAKEAFYRGVSFGDLDGDGDTDVVVVSNAGPPLVLMNQVSWGHWLTVELDSLSAGAVVTVEADGQKLVAPAVIGGSYLGSSDPRVAFGIGESCFADVTVRWPRAAGASSAKKRTLTGVPANQVVRVTRTP